MLPSLILSSCEPLPSMHQQMVRSQTSPLVRNILHPSICIRCATSEGIDLQRLVVPHIKQNLKERKRESARRRARVRARIGIQQVATLTLFPSTEATASCAGPTVARTLCRFCGLFSAGRCAPVITLIPLPAAASQ